MKKLSVILLFIIPCILFLVLRAVCFGDQTIEGIIDGSSPVWDRIKNSDSTISNSCNAVAYDSYNDEVRYKKFLISSSSAEELSVTVIYASENYDPLLALYCEPFDPDNPENNLIAIDDDGAGYPYPQLNNIPLAPDTNYFLVISSYSNYQPWGDFRINLQGNFIVDEGPWEEICDGIDNDDDGQIDEEDALGCTIFYKDKDQDGYGVEGDSLCLCNPDYNRKYTSVYSGDSNDLDPSIQGNAITGHISLPAGWSMISLPIEPEDRKVKMLFPGDEVVFDFTTKYVLLDPNAELEIGKGYWIHLPACNIYSITGTPIDYYEIPDAPSGWSMIGSCSSESIPSVDNGTIRAVFGFDNKYIFLGSGNEIDPLGPGQGFWINLSDQADLRVEKK